MFYSLSKLFWLIAQPLNLIGILLIVSMVALILSWRRLALGAGLVAVTMLALFAWTTAGALMLAPLEAHHAKPDPLPEQVDGIIVLGGAFEGGINQVRGGYELSEGADRMTETAILARRYPQAKVVVSGGSGIILRQRAGDGDTAPRLFEGLGIPRERLILEPKSRNTHENARFAMDMVKPQPGETWLLVTSAFHMPRSVAIFEQAGWPVVAWPTDFRTAGDEGVELCREYSIACLRQANFAIREWIGIVAYWLTGKIAWPFGQPR